jgi:hypothetical protein
MLSLSEMDINNIIRLRGKTNHGKNRVRENGELWKVLDWKSSLKPGLIAVESIQTGDKRSLTADFEIIEKAEL